MAFEIFKSIESEKFYFRMKAMNGEIILQSEAYERKENAQKGIQSVIDNAHEDMFERRTAKDNRLYFVLKAKNHEIIGTSQMYKSKQGVDKGIASVIENSKSPDILDLTNN